MRLLKTLVAMVGGSSLGLAALMIVDHAMIDDPTHEPGPAKPPQPPPHTVVSYERFPNVPLQTHDGRTVRFYDDLIKGKKVALNFMYVGCADF